MAAILRGCCHNWDWAVRRWPNRNRGFSLTGRGREESRSWQQRKKRVWDKRAAFVANKKRDFGVCFTEISKIPPLKKPWCLIYEAIFGISVCTHGSSTITPRLPLFWLRHDEGLCRGQRPLHARTALLCRYCALLKTLMRSLPPFPLQL